MPREWKRPPRLGTLLPGPARTGPVGGTHGRASQASPSRTLTRGSQQLQSPGLARGGLGAGCGVSPLPKRCSPAWGGVIATDVSPAAIVLKGSDRHDVGRSPKGGDRGRRRLTGDESPRLARTSADAFDLIIQLKAFQLLSRGHARSTDVHARACGLAGRRIRHDERTVERRGRPGAGALRRRVVGPSRH